MEFQLCHSLTEIINMKLKVTWKFLKIGYKGYDDIKPQLGKEEICEYGYYLLEDPKYNNDLVSQLVGEKLNEYEFFEILQKLVRLEESDINLQARKWIVYLAKEMISNLEGNYFEDILKINEFWISLGQPKNSPHIYQSVNNEITPQDYYTEKMYYILMKRHKEWILKEIEKINSLE